MGTIHFPHVYAAFSFTGIYAAFDESFHGSQEKVYALFLFFVLKIKYNDVVRELLMRMTSFATEVWESRCRMDSVHTHAYSSN